MSYQFFKEHAQVKCIWEHKWNQVSLPWVFSEPLTNLDAYTYGTLLKHFQKMLSQKHSQKSFKILSKTDTASEGDVGSM